LVPSWSRIKFAFVKPVLGPLAIIAVFGTLVRVKEIIPEQVSFVLQPNKILRVIWPSSAWTSVELAYVASLSFVSAYMLFKLFLPRDIEVSASQNDYWSRSVSRLSELNVAAWFENICEQIDRSEIVISQRDSTIAYRYRDHLLALQHLGEGQSLNDEILNVAKSLAQSKYNYLNQESRFWVRFIVLCLLFAAMAATIVVTLDGVVRSVLSLPWMG